MSNDAFKPKLAFIISGLVIPYITCNRIRVGSSNNQRLISKTNKSNYNYDVQEDSLELSPVLIEVPFTNLSNSFSSNVVGCNTSNGESRYFLRTVQLLIFEIN